jgi:hypothetical protein
MSHKTETIIETQRKKKKKKAARNPKTWYTEPKPNKQKANGKDRTPAVHSVNNTRKAAANHELIKEKPSFSLPRTEITLNPRMLLKQQQQVKVGNGGRGGETNRERQTKAANVNHLLTLPFPPVRTALAIFMSFSLFMVAAMAPATLQL